MVGKEQLAQADRLDELVSTITDHLVKGSADLSALELLESTVHTYGLSSTRTMSVVAQLQRSGRTKSGLYKSLILLEETVLATTTDRPPASTEEAEDHIELVPRARTSTQIADQFYRQGTISYNILVTMLDGTPRTDTELLEAVKDKTGITAKKHNLASVVKKCRTFVTPEGGRVIASSVGPRIAYEYVLAAE